MAKIRVQPHLTASPKAVNWTGWYLTTGVAREQLGSLLEGWDYAQSIRVGTSPQIDPFELERSTELALDEIHLVLSVDCAATAKRFVTSTPVSVYVAMAEPYIDVEIPAGEVALEIRMACHLALLADRELTGLSANRKGSRLAESPSTRLVLEGEASRFPTEALSFQDLRWEAAAWSVRTDLEDLNQVFLGSVRLILNTDHQVGAALAAMDINAYAVLGSVLRIDIVRTILTTAINHLAEHGGSTSGFEEESFGSVAEQLSNEHFGQGLESLTELHRTDLPRFERTIQASVGLKLS